MMDDYRKLASELHKRVVLLTEALAGNGGSEAETTADLRQIFILRDLPFLFPQLSASVHAQIAGALPLFHPTEDPAIHRSHLDQIEQILVQKIPRLAELTRGREVHRRRV